MIGSKEIGESKEKISEGFIRAAQGPATQQLAQADAQAAALGQHLHATTPQRGLHGTAAAIEVLAQTPGSQAKELTRRLVHYIDSISNIEAAVPDSETSQQDIKASQHNVIKMSEVLYSLAAVPTSSAPREELARHIAETLVGSCQPDGGWPYYMAGSSAASDVVPTAYATRALAAHGFDVTGSVKFLVENLKKKSSDEIDIFVQVLEIYVLCYLPVDYRPEKELNKPFEDAWLRLSTLLNQDLEANIEYEGYPKLSLKKYKPIAARNEDVNVSRGLL
jgi:hypothetical protein